MTILTKDIKPTPPPAPAPAPPPVTPAPAPPPSPPPVPNPIPTPVPPEQQKVCFYRHHNYDGDGFCVGVGEANVPGGWNDEVSSVRVPAGFRVELYEHVFFGGRRLVLTADTPDLAPLGFNDQMSSFKVTRVT